MARITVAMLLLPAVAVLSLAVPAFADTTTFRDPRGDAPERFDLTRTTIANGPKRLVVIQAVRELRGRGSQIFGFNAVAGSEAIAVQTIRRGNGAVTVRVVSGGDCVGIRARWRMAASQIRVSMPRDCIDRKGSIGISTFIGAGDGTAGDPADWTKTVRVGQS